MIAHARPSLVFATVAILLAVASVWWAIAAFIYAYHWFATAIMDKPFPESASHYFLWLLLCGIAASAGILGARLWWRQRIVGALACTIGSVLLLFGLGPLLHL